MTYRGLETFVQIALLQLLFGAWRQEVGASVRHTVFLYTVARNLVCQQWIGKLVPNHHRSPVARATDVDAFIQSSYIIDDIAVESAVRYALLWMTHQLWAPALMLSFAHPCIWLAQRTK